MQLISRYLLILLCFAIAGLLPGVTADLAPATVLMWVKADDLDLADGESVAEWPDASQLGHHLTALPENRPTFQLKGLGGKPAVVFNGNVKGNPKVVQYFTAPFSGEYRGMTLFVVGRNLHQMVWFSSAAGGYGNLRMAGNCMQLTSSALQLAGFPVPADTNAPQLTILSCGLNTDGAMVLSSFLNGQQIATATDLTARYGIFLNPPHFGKTSMFDSAFNGAIAEIILYKGVLTDDERDATGRYLSAKYGLIKPDDNTPREPVNLLAPKPRTIPPPVKRVPFLPGMKLWMRADDGMQADGTPLTQLPNSAPEAGNALITSDPGHEPIFLQYGINNRPTLRFDGDTKANPKVQHWLKLPLAGEWPEMTYIVVGRKVLGNIGLIDTAPGTKGNLRYMGGSFALLDSKISNVKGATAYLEHSNTEIFSVTAGRIGETGQYLATAMRGYQLGYTETPDAFRPVVFKEPYIGTISRGQNAFNGEIAEVLIYDRALTDDERYLTEAYLAEKYGLPIKSREVIKTDPKPFTHFAVTYPQLPRTTSWFGNTESGKDSWIQCGIFTIYVQPDGTVAAISVWDEAHKELGLYKDGKSIPGMGIAGGGGYITSDGQYYYVGVSGMGRGRKRAGVKRVTLDLKEAPWPGLEQDKGRIMFDTPLEWDEIEGLVVHKNELFVATHSINEVRVYDIATATMKRTLPIEAPTDMAVDANGKLWVCNNTGVTQYDIDGRPTGKRINDIQATGVCVDGRGRLLISENGVRQQVITYDITGAQPKETAALGVKGGVFAGPRPGAMGDDRLYQPRAVGVDAAGNIYVLCNGFFRSYTPEGALRWHVESNMFCLSSDFDPASDGKDAYTGTLHHRYVPGNPPGKDWVWTGVTADPLRYPDARTSQTVFTHRFNGELYRYTVGAEIHISRQEKDSEIFIPCATLYLNEVNPIKSPLASYPEKGAFIWTDLNGNGLAEAEEYALAPDDWKSEWAKTAFIDSSGAIWEPQGRGGLRCVPLNGFTTHGVPRYSFANARRIQRPGDFIEVRRAMYYPETDEMYLCGYTWEQPALGTEQWIGAGRELIRYVNWSTPARKVVSRLPFITRDVSTVQVLPQLELVFYHHLNTNSVFVHDSTTSEMLGIIHTDVDLLGYQIGWADVPGGSMHVALRKNGEIVITAEDSYLEKQVVYTLPPEFAQSRKKR